MHTPSEYVQKQIIETYSNVKLTTFYDRRGM